MNLPRPSPAGPRAALFALSLPFLGPNALGAAPLDDAAQALARHDWSKAVRLADQAIAAMPNSGEAYRIRGLAENRLKNYPAALADFAAALRINPNDVESVLGRGRSHRLLQQYDAAVADFTQAHAMAPTRARPLCERGAIYILQEKYDASLADYVAAEKLDPKYPGLYSYFAETYLYMRRYDDALAATNKGLALEPNSMIFQVELAHCLLFTGHFEEAKATYLRLQDRMEEGKQIPGREVVRNDFRLMRAAGLSHPDMPKIERAIGIE